MDLGQRFRSGIQEGNCDLADAEQSLDFTNRNTTFMTWNLMHLERMIQQAGSLSSAWQFDHRPSMLGCRRLTTLKPAAGSRITDTTPEAASAPPCAAVSTPAF